MKNNKVTICKICGKGAPVNNRFGTHAKCYRRYTWALKMIPTGTDAVAEITAWHLAAGNPPPENLNRERATILLALERRALQSGSEQRKFRHAHNLKKIGNARPNSEYYERFGEPLLPELI